MSIADAAIIGAGPIGLELAAAFKHHGIDYLHFEAGQIGQTITWYPRNVRFFSSPERIAIAGLPLQTADQSKATREEYLAYLRTVATHFDLEVRTYQKVTAITRCDADDRFNLRSVRGGVEHDDQARCVVLAVGDMHRPRMLHIPGEDLSHVSHYFEDPHPFFRQKLLIVGGKNSAVEAALRCHRAGAQVALSYRGDRFDEQSIKHWLLPELLALINAGKITFLPRTAPTHIAPGQVTLKSLDPAAPPGKLQLPADFVLLLTGYEMDTRLFEMAGAALTGDNRAPVVEPATMMSSVKNLFVAGTAVAGSQVRFRLFIENCHPHVARIFTAIAGFPPDPQLINPTATEFTLPES